MLKEHCDTNLLIESYTSNGENSFTAKREYFYKDGYLCSVSQRIDAYVTEYSVSKEEYPNGTTVCSFGSGESVVYDENKRILMRNVATSTSKFSDLVSESFVYNEDGGLRHYAVYRDGMIVSIIHYEEDSWTEVSFTSKRAMHAKTKTVRLVDKDYYTVTELSEKGSLESAYRLRLLDAGHYVVQQYRDNIEVVKRSRVCVTKTHKDGYTTVEVSTQNSPRSGVWLTNRALRMVLFGDNRIKSFRETNKSGVLTKEFRYV